MPREAGYSLTFHLDRSVLLLEARDRVGGRTYTVEDEDGKSFEVAQGYRNYADRRGTRLSLRNGRYLGIASLCLSTQGDDQVQYGPRLDCLSSFGLCE